MGLFVMLFQYQQVKNSGIFTLAKTMMPPSEPTE
jgi:hypothetical protein